MVQKTESVSSTFPNPRKINNMMRTTSELDWTFLDKGDLFDREEEMDTLHEAVQRRMSPPSRPELILISGQSGTGKTVLAKSLKKSAILQNGFFIIGKFDQLSNPHPYSAFVLAFNMFVTQLLGKGREAVSQIRDAVLQIVGGDSQLLVYMIPALERILGKQDSRQEPGTLESMESQAKLLQITFRNFVRALCSVQIPLLLIMDDLQWADSRSLDMLKILVSDTQNEGFIAIGVCRSNEVSYDHGFANMLRQLEDETETIITHITVKKLAAKTTSHLISCVMNIPQNKCQSLADIIFSKTEGNALFVIQFLQLLLDEKIILKDSKQQGGWLWDETTLSRFQENTDVIDWISLRISHLPENVQIVLKTSACIGSVIDEYLLSVALSNINVSECLSIAVEQGIIIFDEQYKRYVFFHDRIQQAIYAFIPSNEKALVHLSIGRRLKKDLPKEDFAKNIHLVVNQMIGGSSLLDNQKEKDDLATLCLRAGKFTMLSSDFKTAASYFWTGLDLLNQRWREKYDLILELHNAAAESEYCNANFTKVDKSVREVISNARIHLDMVRAYSAQIYSLWARGEQKKAVNVGLHILELLGEKLPAKVGFLTKVVEILGTKMLLSKRTNEDILKLPDILDGNKLASMTILNLIAFYCHIISPDVSVLIATRMIKLSIRNGLCAISGYGFAVFGVICAQLGDLESAYRYGKLSLSILQRFNSIQWVPRVYTTFYGYLASWKQPIRSVLGQLKEAEEVGIASGDIEFSMLACRGYCLLAFAAGIALPNLAEKINLDLEQMNRYKQSWPITVSSFQLNMIHNFLGRSNNPLVLSKDDSGNDAKFLQLHLKEFDKNCVFQFWLWKLLLAYFFGDIDLALNITKKLEAGFLPKVWVIISLVYFYIGMTALAAAAKTNGRKRREHLVKASFYYKKMKKLSKICPTNCMHKMLLMEAEFAAVHRKISVIEICMKYEFAITSASKQGFIHEQALGYELAGSAFYFSDIHRSEEYLDKALSLYNQWGASAKVHHIKKMKQSAEQNIIAASTLPDKKYRESSLRSITVSSYGE